MAEVEYSLWLPVAVTALAVVVSGDSGGGGALFFLCTTTVSAAVPLTGVTPAEALPLPPLV